MLIPVVLARRWRRFRGGRFSMSVPDKRADDASKRPAFDVSGVARRVVQMRMPAVPHARVPKARRDAGEARSGERSFMPKPP